MGCAQGRTQHFSLARDKTKGPRAGWGSWRGGSNPSPTPRGLQERSGVRGGARPPKGVPLFSALRTASPDYIILLTVDYPAASGATPPAPPPLRTSLVVLHKKRANFGS